MNKPFSALAVLCAACAVHACNADADGSMNPDGTDTGNPYGDTDVGENTGGGDGCSEEETELDPGAQTSLGFSGQAIVDLVTGVHTSSLLWVDNETEYGPELGLSEITLDITPLGAPVFIDREVATRSGPGTLSDIDEIYRPCNDSVGLDVSIHVTTAGGALDEVVETSVVANTGDFASGSFSIDLEDIGGTFQATPVAPGDFIITKSSLSAQLGFTSYGSVGAFGISSEFRSADNAVGGVSNSAAGEGGTGAIAHFPAENYCGPAAVSVTADQAVRGLSMAQALDALNATSPDSVEYMSGAPSELTLAFTSTEERVCARFDSAVYGDSRPDSMTLEFPGLVRVISTDGRVDGSIPLRISASSDGGVTETRAEGGDSVQSAAAASGLPAAFGVQDDVDFSSYDGGTVQLLTVGGGQNPGGALRVYGLDVADCVTNPPPFDPDSMGSPGCRGTDSILLWGAYWGEWDVTTQ